MALRVLIIRRPAWLWASEPPGGHWPEGWELDGEPVAAAGPDSSEENKKGYTISVNQTEVAVEMVIQSILKQRLLMMEKN